MSNEFSFENITPEAKEMLKKGGIDPSTLKSGDVNSVLNNLSQNDSKKIESILNDKEALKKVLASDRAKKIINQLFGGEK